MADIAPSGSIEPARLGPNLDQGVNPLTAIIYLGVVGAGATWLGGMARSSALPVSTTRVLSSGIAGTMAANGSGLQWSTVRNIALARVLTLPAAMVLAGVLYFLFAHLF